MMPSFGRSVCFALCACTPAPTGQNSTRPIESAAATASATPDAAPPPDALSATELGAHVSFLCGDELAGREAGSEGERRALEDAAMRLSKLGLDPVRQPFPIKEGNSANVYARLRGAKEDAIVLGAHIDHLGMRKGKMYRGADDNASGTAVVMGVAAHLSNERLERSVVVAFFGAEEIGMVGSKHFVRELATLGGPVLAMVNVDMIGRPLADDPRYSIPKRLFGVDDRRSVGVIGTKDRPAFRSAVNQAFDELKAIGLEDLPPAMATYVSRLADGRSDSYTFEDAGIPALFFSSGESIDYHQPSDTPDRLDLAIMEKRARAIFELVLLLSKEKTALPTRSDRDGGTP